MKNLAAVFSKSEGVTSFCVLSTSEIRSGPWWWMDLEGQWNPPESWPESSPPLPGWRRASDGSWAPPIPAPESVSEDFTSAEPNVDHVGPPAVRPEPDVARPALTMPPGTSPRHIPPSASQEPTDETKPKTPTLQFSETEATLQPTVDDRQLRSSAIMSVALMAVLALAVAALIVAVLALL